MFHYYSKLKGIGKEYGRKERKKLRYGSIKKGNKG
jgi:hypothetical protein